MRLLVISYLIPADKRLEFSRAFESLEGKERQLYPGTCFLVTEDPDPRLVEKVRSRFDGLVNTAGSFVIVWDYTYSTASALLGGKEREWMMKTQKDGEEERKRMVEEFRDKTRKELEEVKKEVLEGTKGKLEEMFKEAEEKLRR